MRRVGQSLVSTLAQIQEACSASQNPMSLSFELIDYPYGYVLYTTTLKTGGSLLVTPYIKDYGYVFLNNMYQVIYRKQ